MLASGAAKNSKGCESGILPPERNDVDARCVPWDIGRLTPFHTPTNFYQFSLSLGESQPKDALVI